MTSNLGALLACVFYIASGADSQPPNYAVLWERFKKDFPKNYANGEEEKRFQYFTKNVDIVYSENAKGHTHQLEVNEFADMSHEEFGNMYLGYKPSLRLRQESTPFPLNKTGLADSVDWVKKGAVTPVKNQKQCGSCWAFSTTGSVEGAYYVATGKLKSLSEEELVQCDDGSNGCKGGDMDDAFGWIKKNGGLCSEADYSYTSGGGVTGTCKKQCSAVVTVGGFQDVPSKDEDALKAAVAKGPVSVAIEADHTAFQLYKGGVLEDTIGCGTKLDHGVLIVGYGTDGGKDYWKVKNSWGPTWGEEGYIRLARGKNMCGISLQASYPTGAKDAPPTPPSPPSPPTPPSPPPSPSPSTSHYEDPKDGCQSDEIAITIQGVSGGVCAPSCSLFKKCPTDVPEGVTAHPQCALNNAATGKKYCALICDPSELQGDQCGEGASCKAISGVGLCTYDDSEIKKQSSASLKMEFDASESEPSVVV